MEKRADTNFPIHELLAQRWSPLAFDERALPAETLGSLFEAVRWSPSSFNEQPWAYFVARREESAAFERLAGCLVPGNATWAAKAPVLALSVAKLGFERNGKPNRHAYHDVGQATAALTFEAEARGLRVHQMAGFDADRARAELAIPEGWEPVAMMSIGHPGDVASLPEDQRGREQAPRSRKELASFLFTERWGEATSL